MVSRLLAAVLAACALTLAGCAGFPNNAFEDCRRAGGDPHNVRGRTMCFAPGVVIKP